MAASSSTLVADAFKSKVGAHATGGLWSQQLQASFGTLDSFVLSAAVVDGALTLFLIVAETAASAAATQWQRCQLHTFSASDVALRRAQEETGFSGDWGAWVDGFLDGLLSRCQASGSRPPPKISNSPTGKLQLLVCHEQLSVEEAFVVPYELQPAAELLNPAVVAFVWAHAQGESSGRLASPPPVFAHPSRSQCTCSGTQLVSDSKAYVAHWPNGASPGFISTGRGFHSC